MQLRFSCTSVISVRGHDAPFPFRWKGQNRLVRRPFFNIPFRKGREDGRSFALVRQGGAGRKQEEKRRRKVSEGRGKREFRRWLGSVKQFRESFPEGVPRRRVPRCVYGRSRHSGVIDVWTGKRPDDIENSLNLMKLKKKRLIFHCRASTYSAELMAKKSWIARDKKG